MTKKEALEAVILELNLDITDTYTRIIATAFALQDMVNAAQGASEASSAVVNKGTVE